jgi:hypothetical protein
VEAAIKARHPEAAVSVQRKEPAESRSDRFSEAQSLVSDAKSEAESLRDELQDWHDNLPILHCQAHQEVTSAGEEERSPASLH